jgi:signal transduction histidine kinase/ActR/RegA family two-component response regulator
MAGPDGGRPGSSTRRSGPLAFPAVEPQGSGRRHVRMITTIVATFGAVLLLGSIFFAAFALSDSSWRTTAVLSLATSAALLSVLLVREIIQRQRSERAFIRAEKALQPVAHSDEDAPDEIHLPEVLEELVRRAASSLRTRWVAVLLSEEGSDELQVAAATESAPRVVGTPVDRAAVTGPDERARHLVPLALEGGRTGIVELGAPENRSFDRDDFALMALVADRMAGEIERARLADAERRSRLASQQARAHVALIADVSIVLARVIEDVLPTLRGVAEALVDQFGDLCIIHLAGPDGRIGRVASSIRPSPGGGTESVTPELSGMDDALQRVMANSRSELTYVDPTGALRGVDDELGRLLRDRGMCSWVIAPIRVRGLPMGTIVTATGTGRRGYRPSDQRVVEEIANRSAIAVERAMLYSETRQAAIAAERRAEQLSRLIEAAISLNPSSSPADLLVTLVDQATLVLQAPRAHAWLDGDNGVEAEIGERPDKAARARSPLVDAAGHEVGYLSVTRTEDEHFSAGDDAVLTLLARLASAAVQNARLYDDVRVREQRLQALFEASPLAILELDVSGIVRDANLAARAMFTGNGADSIELPLSLRACLRRMTVKALAGDVAEDEVSAEGGQGPVELWVSTAPLRGHDALPTGVLAVVSDTTERKRLEEQLTDAHRYEAIARLAGGVAHDFNNLLTIILGYSDLLLQTMPGDSFERDDVGAIHQAGQHAAVITNQLLTLSRNQVVQPIVVPLQETCESLMPMLQRLAGDQVKVHISCETDAAIRIDAGQLEQVLFNLVLNSRDAMPEGGDIRIHTVESGAGDNAAIGIVVADNGVGMDAETLARCREPFFTTKGRRGIGLGLGTVSTIVERSGGRLEITSEPGRGTTISAFFRVAHVTPKVERAAPLSHRARVLLVDDDVAVRGFAYKALNDAGYDVTSAEDAEQALQIAGANGGYDLIVSDVVLPGMNGLELVRKFGHQWPATARLLMTGFAGTDTKGTDLEDVQVLKKPFGVDELARAADAALKQLKA